MLKKDILEFNKKFVENKDYEKYETLDKYPAKHVAILSCMDARLTHLLPAALGFKNGDVKLIKNAGGVIDYPFGSFMRSILLAVYDLGVKEIIVVGHDDCGMEKMDSNDLICKMIDRGVMEEDIANINNFYCDIKKWLSGFDNVTDSVSKTINIIKTHPLIPDDIEIYGLIINPDTGELREV